VHAWKPKPKSEQQFFYKQPKLKTEPIKDEIETKNPKLTPKTDIDPALVIMSHAFVTTFNKIK